MDRARHAIRTLMDLTPADALVVRDGHEHRVTVEDVRVGDVLRIRPGAKVPLDGIVSRRRQRREPGADHRRVAARGQARRRRAVCRDDQRARRARDASDASAARHHAGAHHPPRRSRPGAARPHAGVRRAVRALLHARRDRDRRRYRGRSAARLPRRSSGLAVPGARAARDLVPVRPRHLDARVDRVGARRSGASRRAGEGRRPPGASGRRAGPRLRQDRHAYPRRAGGRGGDAVQRRAGRTVARARGGARIAIGAPDCRRHRAACPRPRGDAASRRPVPCAARARRRGAGARAARARRQPAAVQGSRAARPRVGGDGGRDHQ